MTVDYVRVGGSARDSRSCYGAKAWICPQFTEYTNKLKSVVSGAYFERRHLNGLVPSWPPWPHVNIIAEALLSCALGESALSVLMESFGRKRYTFWRTRHWPRNVACRRDFRSPWKLETHLGPSLTSWGLQVLELLNLLALLTDSRPIQANIRSRGQRVTRPPQRISCCLKPRANLDKVDNDRLALCS